MLYNLVLLWVSSICLTAILKLVHTGLVSALIGLGSVGVCLKNYMARGRTVVEDHVLYKCNNHPESDDEDDKIFRIVKGTGLHHDPPTRPSSRMMHH